MNTSKKNFFDYMRASKQYRIPVYQRGYIWGIKHCQRLWKDIEMMQKSNRKEHFLGSAAQIETVIIDGQQRLVTLSVLLIALRDFVNKNPSQSTISASEITETFLINADKSGDERYKLLLANDDKEAFYKLIENDAAESDLAWRIRENYAFFAEKIASKILLPDEIYQAIGKIYMADIVLDQDDGARAIFEILNAAGDLRYCELIKNYLQKESDFDKEFDASRLQDYPCKDAIRELFEKLNARIFALNPFIRRVFNESNIAYKIGVNKTTGTNFADIHIQNSQIKIKLYIKFDEIIDPKNLCNDISAQAPDRNWADGDSELLLSSLDEVDNAMEIVEQAFRRMMIRIVGDLMSIVSEADE